MQPSMMSFLVLVAAVATDLPSKGTGAQAPHSNVPESTLLAALQQVAPLRQGPKLFSRMQDMLTGSFAAMPKNSQGRLPPRAARLLMYNHFSKRYGWLLKGLEHHGHSPKSGRALHEVSIIQFKAPHIKKALLDARVLERGLSLTEVSAFAVALESLVFDENVGVLEKAYRVVNKTSSDLLTEKQLKRLLQVFVAAYTQGDADGLPLILNGRRLSKESEAEWEKKNALAVKSQDPAAVGIINFVEDAMQTVLNDRPVNYFRRKRFGFDDALRISELLSRRFPRYQNEDCLDMKESLLELDPSNQGRVPLKAFYGKQRSAKYWFEESPEYLRRTGTMDDTEDVDPRVLIANYIRGPANCVASFKYHSVCCLSECAELMGEVERRVGASRALPEQLLFVVSSISSATIKAPRDLHKDLVEKLHSIAKQHRGDVPLHGRLFTQWFHYAFPYECPYPNVISSNSGLAVLPRSSNHGDMISKEEWKEVQSTTETVEDDFLRGWIDDEGLPLEDGVTASEGSGTMSDVVARNAGYIFQAFALVFMFICGAQAVRMLRKRKGHLMFFRSEKYDFEDELEVKNKRQQKTNKIKESGKEHAKDATKPREQLHKTSKVKEDEKQKQDQPKVQPQTSSASVAHVVNEVPPQAPLAVKEVVEKPKKTKKKPADKPQRAATGAASSCEEHHAAQALLPADRGDDVESVVDKICVQEAKISDLIPDKSQDKANQPESEPPSSPRSPESSTMSPSVCDEGLSRSTSPVAPALSASSKSSSHMQKAAPVATASRVNQSPKPPAPVIAVAKAPVNSTSSHETRRKAEITNSSTPTVEKTATKVCPADSTVAEESTAAEKSVLSSRNLGPAAQLALVAERIAEASEVTSKKRPKEPIQRQSPKETATWQPPPGLALGLGPLLQSPGQLRPPPGLEMFGSPADTATPVQSEKEQSSPSFALAPEQDAPPPPPGLAVEQPPPVRCPTNPNKIGARGLGPAPSQPPPPPPPPVPKSASTSHNQPTPATESNAKESMLAAQVQDLAAQLEQERQARQRLEFILRDGGLLRASS